MDTLIDINTLRGLATVFTMIAFLGISLWAYSSKRKDAFDEAAMLPFQDDPPSASAQEQNTTLPNKQSHLTENVQ